MKTFTVLFLLVLLFVFQSYSQVSRQPVNSKIRRMQVTQLQPAAQKALETFTMLVTKENFRQMGFESVEEVRYASLGTPVRDYMVRLDMLRKYIPGSNPEDLLNATGQVYYPLLVKDQVKSSITLSGNNDNWKPVSYGSPNFIRQVSKILKNSMRSTGLDYSVYFLVRIPSLNLFFLGFHSGNQLMLVPFSDNIKYNLKEGREVSAEKVFTMILPDAKTYQDLPR